MGGQVIYIGADHMISPLGRTSEENFQAISQGMTGLRVYKDLFQSNEDILCGRISDYVPQAGLTKIESLILESINASLSALHRDISHDRVLLILSTTKGDIEHLKSNKTLEAKPHALLDRIAGLMTLSVDTRVISNACISGVLSVIHGHDLLKLDQYDHVIVVGADLVSEFIYRGFSSFHALSPEPCRPFDTDRKGVTLGEGVASVVLSQDVEVYRSPPLLVAGGASANDANHISGPSRNGEGLYRAIQRCFKQCGLDAKDVDFVSAHGTATQFNDDMESVAFNRSGLASVPTNSFKGYIGHTLGAAGILELIFCMHSMRNHKLIKSLECDEVGTTEVLNIITENQDQFLSTILKTASGFGGCNAAVIIQSQAT